MKNVWKIIVLSTAVINSSCAQKNAEPEKYYVFKMPFIIEPDGFTDSIIYENPPPKS